MAWVRDWPRTSLAFALLGAITLSWRHLPQSLGSRTRLFLAAFVLSNLLAPALQVEQAFAYGRPCPSRQPSPPPYSQPRRRSPFAVSLHAVSCGSTRLSESPHAWLLMAFCCFPAHGRLLAAFALTQSSGPQPFMTFLAFSQLSRTRPCRSPFAVFSGPHTAASSSIGFRGLLSLLGFWGSIHLRSLLTHGRISAA